MTLQDSDLTLIQKYLTDNLSEQEKKVFKIKCSNKKFRDELLLNISLLKNISDAKKGMIADKLEFLNLLEGQNIEVEATQPITYIEQQDVVHAKKASNWKLKLVLPIIFIGLLFSVYYFTQKSQKTVNTYAENLILNTQIVNQYGMESRGLKPLTKEEKILVIKKEIEEASYNKKYKKAVTYFEDYEQYSTLSFEDKFFYATAILKAKLPDEDKAILLLSDIINNKKEFYLESLWFRALAYGAKDDIKKMQNDLLTLKNNSNYRKDEVNSLLNMIK